MDWSFLFEPNGVEDFVEDLFAFDVIVFETSRRLPRVVRLKDTPVNLNGDVELVVANGRDDESAPWFRVIFKNYSETNPVNKSLEQFFIATGILGVHARCDSATVMAMMDKRVPDSYVDVPEIYYQHAVPAAENLILSRDEALQRLDSIPGELVWYIFRYLRHPTASVMHHHWTRQSTYWNHHFERLVSRASAW